MPQEQMPESLWIKVQEGHHQRYISVYSVPATEHTEYVPASHLLTVERERDELLAVLKEIQGRAHEAGLHGIVSRISALTTQKVKP